MRSPSRIESDRLTKGQRARTNQSASMREAATGGAARVPMDEFVTWTGNTPTVTKVLRFGQVGGRGFSEGGMA